MSLSVNKWKNNEEKKQALHFNFRKNIIIVNSDNDINDDKLSNCMGGNMGYA